MLLRAAVRKQLEHFDEHFLAALNGYVNAASERAARDSDAKTLLRLLLAVRQETLAAVGTRLPSAMRVVEALTVTRRAADRVKLLETAAAGGGYWPEAEAEVPLASLSDVENAAARLLEQMEDKDECVMDADLLVRVALAREAARDAIAAHNENAPRGSSKIVSAAFTPSTLPRWETALLKELVAIGDPVLRRGLLQLAFQQALRLGNNPDVSLRATGPKPAGGRWGTGPEAKAKAKAAAVADAVAQAAAASAAKVPKQVALRNPRPGEADDPNAPPPVRPGRFLDCTENLLCDIQRAEDYATRRQCEADAVWSRVRQVRGEAIAILEDMAHFK
jgi:hypothetical protein